MSFDPSAARRGLERLWSLGATFGMERGANHVYLNELVSDRYALVSGMQLLRDELQLADMDSHGDVRSCGADLSVPSVVTTLAFTNCGDRIHQGEAARYRRVVASRFATLAEVGDVKLESFSPTGGGVDDGATLAHVTVQHQLDAPLRARIYSGNAASFVVVALDLKAHVGRLDEGSRTTFGSTRESPWREPRAACGAIVGTLRAFEERNAVHRRIRSDLGEENYARLTQNPPRADDGTDLAAVVAACIVAVRGMLHTADALRSELDERGVGHLTASVTVNRTSLPDTVIYLTRATVFGGVVEMQGFGTEAARYGASLVPYGDDRRLLLRYGDCAGDAFARAVVPPNERVRC